MSKPVVLAVLDGWGVTPPGSGNAIDQAKTPVFDSLVANYPHASLKSFGESVGLPWQEMGNSEVGHLNIGAGRIVYQDLVKITKSVDDGSFFSNAAFHKAVMHVRTNDSALHIVGCLSEGGIHAHIVHAEALLELAAREKLKEVYVHMILDGSDTPPDTGVEYVARLQKKMKKLKVGKLATLSGRFFAMDRDNHWDRIAQAYHAMVDAEGPRVKDPKKALKQAYSEGVFDESFVPSVIEHKGEPVARVQDGDAVIYSNYRSDRAKQLTKAFVLPGIDEKVGRTALLKDLLFVTMTEYDNNLPVEIAFPTDHIANSLGEVISLAGKKQFRVAETEKYAHITVFFSAGRIDPFEQEQRQLIPSVPVKSYDEAPEMSAEGVADALLEALKVGEHDFYLVNFANPDMVGHTANVEAAIESIEFLDGQLGRVWEQVKAMGGALLVTADHGNAEVMKNLRSGEIDKSHTS
ncbi:MAG: 2,3-bisphosphoglycerate-independent phosphoglycerate mutase, partial [Candidatus Andersenbacteria bacterium]|nr:2,3-bisphosphoglycerate-independent phosphoglycerate mutase [Candidatus Andersenbacteria bacterium]